MKEPQQFFLDQAQKFREMFQEEMRRPGNPLGKQLASQENAIAFAEALMLCPTEDAARARIALDREGARACYVIAGDAASAVERGSAFLLVRPTTQHEPPFGLIGEFLKASAEGQLKR